VLELPLFSDLQKKAGELVIFITFNPKVIIIENTLIDVCKNVIMVTLTTGIMFLLFVCMHFWVWGNFRKVVDVCGDVVSSGPRLQKV
jgi:hypothetical protein